MYEINEKTELSLSALKKIIVQAVEKLNDNLYKRRIKLTTKDIRPFLNPGKPLAEYDAKELSRFLKNDTYFEKRSTTTDNTQVTMYEARGRRNGLYLGVTYITTPTPPIHNIHSRYSPKRPVIIGSIELSSGNWILIYII